MNTVEAIDKRYSRRSYLNTPIDISQLKILKSAIEKYNTLSGLSIRLIENAGGIFKGFTKSYGFFQGVNSCIALAGASEDKHLKEKAGYYGELLVLEATKLGLGTCFVSGTYDKKNCLYRMNEEENLVCVITIGNVKNEPEIREKLLYHAVHRGTKKLEDLYESDISEVPEWFHKGMEAVRKAPSAMNRQPVRFTFRNNKVTAYVKSSESTFLIDLGIAKANFELAAGGHFELGNYGAFIRN